MNISMVDYTSEYAPGLFAESLKNTGFAVLTHHPIKPALVDTIYAEWQAFFASNEKFDYLFDKKNQIQDGYFPFLSESAKDTDIKDLKEFYHLYLDGRYPRSLSPKTRELCHQLTQLANTLLGWIELNTPLKITSHFSMPLTKMISEESCGLLRILNYPPLEGNEQEGAVRAAPHEDINLITLLPAATTTGLQVKNTMGEWYDVPCNPGSIIVNVGDMLQLCSQGYYTSTTHQVVNPVGDAAKVARLSMPLFLHPAKAVRLSDTHTAGSYLAERLAELGLT